MGDSVRDLAIYDHFLVDFYHVSNWAKPQIHESEECCEPKGNHHPPLLSSNFLTGSYDG